MKVLVLLSTYNGEDYLVEQLDSILNQKTSCNVDLLIRDDGSKDSTVDIIKDYIVRYQNIHLIEGENIGCTASFFELIRVAKNYDYYCISDQDDVWLDDKIETAVSMLDQEKNIPLLYGGVSSLVDENLTQLSITGKRYREITFYNTAIQNIMPGHTQVFNPLLLDLINNDLDYSKIYYYDSWIANVATVCGKIIFDNTPHTLYRQHTTNELGYGTNKVAWIKERIKRIGNNDGKKYAVQMSYFYKKYESYLPAEQKEELDKFFKNQKNFFSRLKYVVNTKFYRQKKDESLMFRVLYLFKGYNK